MADRTEATKRTRRVLVVDNSHVARRIGERIRQARLRANLTQAEVSRGRYTAAYISALERGLAKPSMAALTFLSERLGVPIPDLVAEERPAASRLEADLLLAAGNFRDALDRYTTLLDEAGDDRRQRAELLRGSAEALCRLERGQDAVRPAAEAAEIFDSLGAAADAAWARYWLAYASYLADNTAEARRILSDLLHQDGTGLKVAPDFRFRLLTALGNVASWEGDPDGALVYMEQARTLIEHVSLRQRAAFLSGLALQYRFAGDLERSIRVGHESLALYQAIDTDLEQAGLHVNMAVNYLDIGNAGKARDHLAEARGLVEPYESPLLISEILESEARVAFVEGEHSLARERAEAAIAAEPGGGSRLAAVRAQLLLARLAVSGGDRSEAEQRFESAVDGLRDHPSALLREVLGEWAAMRAAAGDLAGANELYAEALSVRSRQ